MKIAYNSACLHPDKLSRVLPKATCEQLCSHLSCKNGLAHFVC